MSDTINCLRCRHAQNLPHSDFAPVLQIRGGKVEIDRDVIVPIFCGKTARNRPAHLFENCAIADPRPTFVRHRKIGGDRAKKFNPVARAFLVAVYPTWPQSQWDELCAVMERTPDVIKLMANRFGVIRETTPDEMKVRMVRANEAMQASGWRMNAAQMEYILTRHRSGDWPIVGGCNKGAFYEKRVALKDEIVAAVSALGAPKTWRQINQHVYSMSPAAKRQDRAKRPRKILK